MKKLAFKRVGGQWEIVEFLPERESILNASFLNELKRLRAYELEDFEERSAIMEYEAGLPRERAEQEALRLILKKRLAN